MPKTPKDWQPWVISVLAALAFAFGGALWVGASNRIEAVAQTQARTDAKVQEVERDHAAFKVTVENMKSDVSEIKQLVKAIASKR